MDSIKEFKSSFQSWNSPTIVVIIVGVRGGGNNKSEKKILIVNGKNEFDQDVFTLGNNFKTKYEQLFQAYNGGQCVLIENIATTSKGDQYLRRKLYTILKKVVDETSRARLFKLHDKLLIV
jgi:hypothetical protein